MNVSARMAAATHDSPRRPRRSASAALMPLAEAIAHLIGGLAAVAPRPVPVFASVGRIAATDIRGEGDCPPYPVALRDGWAACAAAAFGASPYAPIILGGPLAWVESGDAMPVGTDVVLPPEALDGRTLIADAPILEGVRSAGAEFGAGTCLIPAGLRITPRHRFALTAAGRDTVPVRIPRLRLVVTGAPEPDGLSALVAAMAEAEGAAVTETVGTTDEPEAIAAALDAPDVDAIVVIGGTGFGRSDGSADGLARAGSVHVHGIALRPGQTAGFGAANGRPVLLLPGRPDAALSVFLALGRPLLAALAGAAAPVPARAALVRKVVSVIGLSEIVFVRRTRDGVLPLGGADLALHSLIAADSAILLAAEAEGYPAGTPVDLLAL